MLVAGQRRVVRRPKQNKMYRWSDDKTLLFIKLYREQSCLWDPTDPHYKSQFARDAAYDVLREGMNDPNLDIRTIKVKIKNLRTTYHQQLKIIRNTQGTFKPALSWFEEMDSFLGNTVEIRRLSSLENSQPTHQSENEEDQTEFHEEQPEASEHIKREVEEEISAISNENRRKKRRVDETPELVHPIQMTRRMDNVNGDPSRFMEDEFHFFGLNVAAQLRNLPIKHALKTQAEIMDKLYRVRLLALREQSRYEDREDN